MADYSKILKNDWSVTTKTLFAWIVVSRDANGNPKRLGAAGAVYLSQIHFWRGVYARPFHKTWWQLQLETGLNREEQKTARKRLGSLVKTVRRRPRLSGNKIGDAPVIHYDLDYGLLATLLEEAAEGVSEFIEENARLGEEPHSDWGQGPIPIGAVDPRSIDDPTAQSTTESKSAADAAPSSQGSSLSVSKRHSPDVRPSPSKAKEKKGQGGAADSWHTKVMARASDLFEARYGERPAMGGKEGKAVAELIKQYGGEKVLDRLERLALVSESAKLGSWWDVAPLPSVLRSRWNSRELIPPKAKPKTAADLEFEQREKERLERRERDLAEIRQFREDLDRRMANG